MIYKIYTTIVNILLFFLCTFAQYSLAVIGLAVDLSLPNEARLLPIQRAHAHATAQAVRVPRAAANLEEKSIRDRLAARCAGTQLSLAKEME